MRNFEVTLTYKALLINHLILHDININQQKVINVELEDSNCLTPEDFCNAVISQQDRPKVVRMNIKEKNSGHERQLYWIQENFGRIYFYNGIPLILNKN